MAFSELIQSLFENKATPSDYKNELNEIYSDDSNKDSRKLIEERLIEKNASFDPDLFSLLDDKLGAIRLACLEDLFYTIKYFDAKGADFHELDYSNDNSIHWASDSGSLRIFDYLIDKGINAFQINSNENNALFRAVSNNRIEIVKKLLDYGLDVNALGENQKTALIKACAEGHKEIVEILINKGADLNVKDGIFNRNALHYACINRHANLVNYLIEKGSNVNERDVSKMTCLHFAAESDALDCIKILTKKGLL
jgi:ankyrin repeat protein